MTVARDRFDRFAGRTRERFEKLTSRLSAEAHKARARAATAPALNEDYWKALRDLFTRDVNVEGLSALLQQESQDTFRFFTREIELADVRHRPWYAGFPRYPPNGLVRIGAACRE